MVQFVSAAAERAVYKVIVEPRIVGCTLDVQKPDLVLWNKSKAYVADVTITSDQVERAKAHHDKVPYYDQPEIRSRILLGSQIFPFLRLPPIGGVSCRLSVWTF